MIDENLKERFCKVLELLFENHVFSRKHNSDPYFLHGSSVDLQLRTCYLSLRDMKVIVSVCQLYSLDVSVNEIASLEGQTLSVIFTSL